MAVPGDLARHFAFLNDAKVNQLQKLVCTSGNHIPPDSCEAVCSLSQFLRYCPNARSEISDLGQLENAVLKEYKETGNFELGLMHVALVRRPINKLTINDFRVSSLGRETLKITCNLLDWRVENNNVNTTVWTNTGEREIKLTVGRLISTIFPQLRWYFCTVCYEHFHHHEREWRNHEKTKHTPNTYFSCTIDITEPDAATTSKCWYHFGGHEEFYNHLLLKHGRNDQDAKASHKQWREYEGRFWYGFCGTIFPTDKGVDATMDKRLDHLNDHFRHGSPDIDKWLPLLKCNEDREIGMRQLVKSSSS
ncbi:hypothetical protein GX51_04945 [Blastomyces parvus]|uniref:C2H2-type domain-containing protein n=1 Tax=Blastomyces parvus TaxID=2060905 RepID=A0A2B7WZH6_9EURO|nr:hypothetical protein GX51_04945 [Blastomyces parvus]